MKKLSVVISAYNEEGLIEDCLRSVSHLADEIVVINNTSLDKTEQIAKKYTEKIFLRPNLLMLNVNKNFGFEKAEGEWILNLDADERVTLELEEEIKGVISDQKSDVSGYLIPRKNIIFRKWIKSEMWWPDYQLRLFKKGRGKFPEKHIHELLEVEGKTEKLNKPLVHENYSSIAQFLNKMDKIYTENEVNNYILSGQKLNWLDALRFPFNDFLKTFLHPHVLLKFLFLILI